MTFITLNGKQYTVKHRNGEVEICITWETPCVADRHSAHPSMVSHYRYISPYGRLGKQILKLLKEQP